MPNYCENKLTITGNKEDLGNFLKKHWVKDKNYLSLNTIIPEPLTKEECPEEYIIPEHENRHLSFNDDDRTWFDWYRFHLKEWNTKWDTFDCTYCISGDTITMWFITAWTPCLPCIYKLIDMYPNLTFEYSYFEEGMIFAGSLFKPDNNSTYVESYYEGPSDVKDLVIAEHFMSEETFKECYEGGDE